MGQGFYQVLPGSFWQAACIKSFDRFHRYSFLEGEHGDLGAEAVGP
jgi:hypothetical protein